MLNIVLAQPEIPSNTGNIIRLCANTGAQLHLIYPLGFLMDDKRLRRAGLDYHEFASIKTYLSDDDFFAQCNPSRIFAIETNGRRQYDEVSYKDGDFLLFGSETAGLSQSMMSRIPEDNVLVIPMVPDCRSLNLSNSVALVTYEAWRQLGFKQPHL